MASMTRSYRRKNKLVQTAQFASHIVGRKLPPKHVISDKPVRIPHPAAIAKHQPKAPKKQNPVLSILGKLFSRGKLAGR